MDWLEGRRELVAYAYSAGICGTGVECARVNAKGGNMQVQARANQRIPCLTDVMSATVCTTRPGETRHPF
jgi:hypothetical protein